MTDIKEPPKEIWAEPYSGHKWGEAGRWTSKPRYPDLPTRYILKSEYTSLEQRIVELEAERDQFKLVNTSLMKQRSQLENENNELKANRLR